MYTLEHNPGTLHEPSAKAIAPYKGDKNLRISLPEAVHIQADSLV